MKPYSEDLRLRIVKALQVGTSKSAAARLFSVSLSSVKRYAKIAERGESLEPRKGGGRRPPKADETIQRLLEEDVHERPAATIADRSRFLQSMTGKSLSVSTLKRLLKRMSFSQKNGLWGRWNGMSGEERPGR
jgi:transposase